MTIRSAAFVFALLAGVACRQATPTPSGGPAATTPGAAGTAASAPAGAPAPQPPAGPPGVSQIADPAVAPVKAVPPRLPDVIARVNGDPITGPDLEEAVRNLEAGVGQAVPIERRDSVYRQMLDELIGFRLLAQAAAAERLVVPDSEVDGRLSQIRQQFPSEQAFLGELAQRKMTVDRLRRQIQSQLQVAKIVEKHVAPGIQIADQDVSGFYEQNKGQFNEPEAVRASHILIRADEKADEAMTKAARTQADQLLARARKGEDFSTLAREYSQDPGSAAGGGDLGFFAKGQTAPAFETAAFKMKPGELSGVIQTPFGFHILKVAEHRAARQVPLPEASDRIREFLLEQQRQQKTAALVQGLRAKAKVEILM